MSIDIVSKSLTNGPGDRGSIPGGVIPKTRKMVRDPFLHCFQHYKDPLYGSRVSWLVKLTAFGKGSFGLTSMTVGQRTYICEYLR